MRCPHGRQILKDPIFRELYEAERASTQDEKRVLEGKLRFAIVKTPADQPVRFDSVPATVGWRSGPDLFPSSDTLESAVPKLFP